MTEPEGIVYLGSRHREAALREENPRPQPRLGRRESEPHSFKINYIHDVLSSNFPKDRVLWDLHHYFTLGQSRVDLQFDISYFRNFEFKDQLSSYDEQDHDFRRPDMVINILSKSTFNSDLGINAETCMKLKIPVYVVFSDHLPEPEAVRAPLLKVFYRSDDKYVIESMTEPCCTEGETGVDLEKTIGIDLLPFRLGIMKLKDRYWVKGKRHDLYQLMFIDKGTGEILKTKAEKERERAEMERKRADLAEQRLKELERKLSGK